MNANELADLIGLCGDGGYNQDAANMLRQQQEQIDKLTAIVALRELKIERMIEKQSHYEAMAHAGGFEAGRQQAFFDRAREVAKQIDNNEYHTPED